MLLSRNRLLLGISLFFLGYFSYQFISSNLDSTSIRLNLGYYASEHQSNLAATLHPQDHVNRLPKTIHHTWKITTGLRSPDGVVKRVYLINGQFPGPLIEARSGDELVIDVQNNLKEEGVAIHWHGLWMQGANEMDGAVGLTQCPISPSKSSTYKFKINADQAGTFWYHSHSELQRADGLYGGLVIHKPSAYETSEQTEYSDDEEVSLLIGDWYHRPSHEVQDYYKDFANAGNEPAPDSLLINGAGHFDCSMAVAARPVKCKQISIPHLQLSGNRTRLRIVNTGAMVGVTISVVGYTMTLLQVDGGGHVSPASSADSVGILYPGERMDAIIEINPAFVERLACLRIELDSENLSFRNFALSELQEFPIQSLGVSNSQIAGPPIIARSIPFYDLGKSTGLSSSLTGMPQYADETLVLYTKIEILGEYNNAPKGFINQTSWEIGSHEQLPLLALNRSDWRASFVPYIVSGTERWVDIVLNNFDDRGHPFHLHGNDFFVLSVHEAGIGGYDEAYNPFDLSKPPAGGPMNTENPVRKDTIFVPAMGYAVLRFNANNRGLWFFHCHVLWHQAVGMAMALHIGDNQAGFLDNGIDILKAGQLCK